MMSRKRILVLLLIALPIIVLVQLSRWFRAVDRDMACATQLASLGRSLKEYWLHHSAPAPNLRAVLSEWQLDRPFYVQCAACDTEYVYLPRPLDGDPYSAVAFDLYCEHRGKRGCVLFADGHVECLPSGAHSPVIRSALKAYARELASRPASPPTP